MSKGSGIAHTPEFRRQLRAKLLVLRKGCEICGIAVWSELVLHHKRYRHEIEMRDLSLLCRKHHDELHSFVRANDPDLPRFTDVYIKGMHNQ